MPLFRFSSCLIPCLLAGIGLYSLCKGVDTFPVFISGAKQGMRTAIGLLPTLIGLLTAVYMLRASGFLDLAQQFLAPVLNTLGIPEECASLVLLKPLSGSGGLALGTEIIQGAGVDSYIGRVAAVMLGASETSLYTISVYCGHIGLKDTRYLIPAALIGDLVAFTGASFFVSIFLT